MAGGGGGGDGEPEFQIAPMIDVLLVLLIFFMSITSAQVLKVDKHITLPKSPDAKKPDPEAAKHETAINIRWDAASQKSTMVIDDKPLASFDDAIAPLQALYEKDKKLRVVIRADRDLPNGEVQKVMNTVGQAGIASISFSATNR